MVIEKIRPLLETYCQLVPNRPIIAGVSGGPDSLCLLGILHQLQYPVIVAHFDHQLRTDSARDADRVRAIAAEWGLSFILGRKDVGALARQEHLSIEEAARKARYRFLFEQAALSEAQAVAVGHTADDQVETMLMHLLRGAGLAGLRGMTARSWLPEWDCTIPLVRPLLFTWREETVAFCYRLNLNPVQDESNLDTTFFRNRLRHALIPFLKNYNPRIKEVLLRTTQTLSADYETLLIQTDRAWEICQVDSGDGFVILSLEALRSHDVGMQRSVLRRAIARLRPGLRDVDFESIDRAVDFIRDPTQTHRTDLVRGLELRCSVKEIWITDPSIAIKRLDWPWIQPGQVTRLDFIGRIELGSGWILESQLDQKPACEVKILTDDPFVTQIDADTVGSPLEIRTRKPGDRFAPLGMHGHTLKLSDFFVNVQLPLPAREGWPLVCSREQIIWIPGFRPAEHCRIQSSTRNILLLRLFRSETLSD